MVAPLDPTIESFARARGMQQQGMMAAASSPKYQAQILESRRQRQDKKAGSGDGRGKTVRPVKG